MTPLLTLTGAVSVTRPKRRRRRWPAAVIAGPALGALLAWHAHADPAGGSVPEFDAVICCREGADIERFALGLYAESNQPTVHASTPWPTCDATVLGARACECLSHCNPVDNQCAADCHPQWVIFGNTAHDATILVCAGIATPQCAAAK